MGEVRRRPTPNPGEGQTEQFESDVVLADGSLVHVSPLRNEDRPILLDFLKRLSSETVAFRFFGTGIDREGIAEKLLPAPGRFALIAVREERVIAHAAYHITSPGRGEVSVVISEPYQRKGLGTILLGQLAEAANRSGISELEAQVAPENYRIIEVIRESGLPIQQRLEPGLIRIIYPTSLLQESIGLFEQRETMAAVAAVRNFLQPRSVAVIGASRELGTIGGELFRNILEDEFRGPVYPVNQKADVVQSVVAYHSILDCPGPVDLAIVVVPASSVVPVAKECARKGVRALVVISAGFAESGAAGDALQQELVEVCRQSGMRLIGPNCMGLINTDPDVNLNAQFSLFKPSQGRIAFLSQSGALGIAVIDLANKLGLGLSSFISVGNKADISGNDLIEYWESDEKTDVILLYLESFGNPRKFARITKRVARKKPIITVKSGRSSAGFRATQSHTGALVAASDVTVDALFRQSGTIRTDTLEEMFDVAALVSSQPLPRGDRVAIITNAGGAGILAADACEDLGLEVPQLLPETQAALRSFLHPTAGVRNPVDMIASATADQYGRTMRMISRDPNVDAMIVIFVPPIAIRPQDIANEILSATQDLKGQLPVLATFMASHGIPSLLSNGNVRIPSYPFPETAAHSLAKSLEYARWLAKPEGVVSDLPGVRRDEAMANVASALSRGEGWLSQDEGEDLLDCYGLPLVKTLRASTPENAGRAAAVIGGKVVLKAVAPGLIHKMEVGAVKLGLEGEIAVKEAANEMMTRLDDLGMRATGFLVQPLVSEAAEMLIGVTHDPIFGPVVACGAGGTLVELLRDVAVRLTPLTDSDAGEMVDSLKTSPLLRGYRGAPKRDVKAFEQVILRTGRLVADIPEVVELDLNPVMVLREGEGALVVDFRIRVAESRPPLPIGAKKR